MRLISRLRAALDVELDRHADAGRRHDGGQDPQQVEQQREVALLQGVEEVAVPDVEPERDADIGRGGEGEARGQRPGDQAIARCRPIATGNDGKGPYRAVWRVQVTSPRASGPVLPDRGPPDRSCVRLMHTGSGGTPGPIGRRLHPMNLVLAMPQHLGHGSGQAVGESKGHELNRLRRIEVRQVTSGMPTSGSSHDDERAPSAALGAG